MTPDRIEKQIVLNAPRDRVWRAISEADRFGSWFGVAFDGPFVPGQRLTGRITPTTVDADIAKLQQPHAGKAFEFMVEQLEPLHVFAFRWHPFAVEPGVDYSREPATLVRFELADAEEGTRLTIVESGFSQLPEARRQKAYDANDGGWSAQTRLIEKYLQRGEN